MYNVKQLQSTNLIQRARHVWLQVCAALLSKACWTLHLAIAMMAKSARMCELYLMEDMTKARVGYFSTTVTYTVYFSTFITRKEVGNIILRTTNRKLDVSFMGIANIQQHELAACLKFLDTVLKCAVPYFEQAEVIAIDTELHSSDVRMSSVKMGEVIAAQQNGVLNFMG